MAIEYLSSYGFAKKVGDKIVVFEPGGGAQTDKFPGDDFGISSLNDCVLSSIRFLEDIYKRKTSDGSYSRMPVVILSEAENAVYNKLGSMSGYYKPEDLLRDPHDPLYLDDPVLVGTPWGLNKERYTSGLRCVLNAARIFGHTTPADPTYLGYGYWSTDNAQAKWQGNSTLATAKKSFTIKFPSKFEVKPGWGKRKKYVVKNNTPNSTISNILCAKLWGDVVRTRAESSAVSAYSDPAILSRLIAEVNCGCIDGFPCTYVVNGSYYGFGTFNIPKDEDLLGMGDDAVAAMFTAGSNERQLWGAIKSAAQTALQSESCTIEELVRAMVGSFNSGLGLLGTVKRFVASSEFVFYPCADKLIGRLKKISPTSSSLETDVREAVLNGLIDLVDTYKYHLNEGTERDSQSLSKFSMWSAYTNRCLSAVWLRSRILECLDGIVNGLVLGFNGFANGGVIDEGLAIFSSLDPTLFQATLLHKNDGFETEFVSDGWTEGEAIQSLNALIETVGMLSKDADSISELTNYVDISSVVDLMVMTFLSQDIDQMKNNYILSTFDGSKWFYTPYDMNQTFIIAGAGFLDVPTNKLSLGIDDLKTNKFYDFILSNNITINIFKERYKELREGVLSDYAVYARASDIISDIAPQAYLSEVVRWPMYGYGAEVWSANSILDRYTIHAKKCDEIVNSL